MLFDILLIYCICNCVQCENSQLVKSKQNLAIILQWVCNKFVYLQAVLFMPLCFRYLRLAIYPHIWDVLRIFYNPKTLLYRNQILSSINFFWYTVVDTGIEEKLGYLKDINVNAVWISPFYASPMLDFGYDVSDYRAIDPVFGTMDDFDSLLQEMHKNGKSKENKMHYVMEHRVLKHRISGNKF